MPSFETSRTANPPAPVCEHCGHARLEGAAACQECGASYAVRPPWIRRPRVRANLAAWAAAAWVLVPIFDFQFGRNFIFVLGWCCARLSELSFSSNGFRLYTGWLALALLCSLVASILAGFAWRRGGVGARIVGGLAVLSGWTLAFLILRAGPG
jgi:hypothetical protein